MTNDQNDQEKTDRTKTDLYSIAARVKNLARDWDASLTPMGEKLCNCYIMVLKDLYDFAEKLPEPHKKSLLDLIESKEDFPRQIIKLNRKARK